MKKLLAALALVAMLSLASCNKEEATTTEETATGTTEEVSTETTEEVATGTTAE